MVRKNTKVKVINPWIESETLIAQADKLLKQAFDALYNGKPAKALLEKSKELRAKGVAIHMKQVEAADLLAKEAIKRSEEAIKRSEEAIKRSENVLKERTYKNCLSVVR